MSDIDVSLLSRVVQTYLLFHPETAGNALPILQAASEDGNPTTLSDAEQNLLLNAIREQTDSAREQLNIITANRENLVGTLRAAQRRLREAGATDETVSILEEVARTDGEEDELSEAEVAELLLYVDQQLTRLPEASLALIRDQVEALLVELAALREREPMAFLPTSRTAQRAPVNLDFLKSIPESAFVGEDEQAQMLQQLIVMGRILTMDEAGEQPVWQSREETWELTWEDMAANYESIPEERRAEMPAPEVMMANMRYLANQFEEGLNARMAEIAVAGEGETADTIAMQDLLDRSALFSNDPFFELLVGMAGDDGVLTRIEVERRTRELQEEEGVVIDPAVFMVAANAWVQSRRTAMATETATLSEIVYPRSQYTSIMALTALDGISATFTRADREHVENSTATGIANAATWILTLGGLLTAWIDNDQWEDSDLCLGPTFRHYARGEVDANARDRDEALALLRQLLTHPTEEFTEYLEENASRLDRQNGNHEPNIPNVLHFLAHSRDSEDPERYSRIRDVLTGNVLQTERIWRIYQTQEEGDRDEAEEMWTQLAEDLRGGVWSDDTYLMGIANPFFAESIYSYMISKSGDEADHPEWRRSLDDALGVAVLDEACLQRLNSDELDAEGEDYGDRLDECTLEEPRGESLWWPGNWFDWGGFLDGRFALNWSDQQENEVIGDIAGLVIGWRVGGWAFRIFEPAAAVVGATGTRALTAAVESSAIQRLLTSVGVNLTEEMAGRTILQRLFGPMAARWVASAEAAVTTAANAEARSAAEVSLARALQFQARLNAEESFVTAMAHQAAPRLTGWMGRAVRAHPPVPTFLEAAAENGRRGLGAVVARGGVQFIENFSLSGVGRGLRYIGYEGLVMMALVRGVYDNLRGDPAGPNDFDREIELGLPLAPLEDEGEDSAEDTEDAGAARDSARRRDAAVDDAPSDTDEGEE